MADFTERLKSLAELRANGALTEEEFQSAKERVLSENVAEGRGRSTDDEPVPYTKPPAGPTAPRQGPQVPISTSPTRPFTSLEIAGLAPLAILVIVGFGLYLLRDTYEWACELTGGDWFPGILGGPPSCC